MPNHITNILYFSNRGEEILEFIKGDEVEQDIDFNKIIPMPKSLKITAGTSTDNGKAIILYKEYGITKNLDEMMDYFWVKEGINKDNPKNKYEWLCDALKDSADLEEGRIAIENEKKYGYESWYGWACDNWGTKWNAYSSIVGDNSIQFQTAWSCPFPIISKLAKLFPDVTITVKFADEDCGSNCGEFDIFYENGELKENLKFEGDGGVISQAFAYHVYDGGDGDDGELDLTPVFINYLENYCYKGEFNDDGKNFLNYIKDYQKELIESLKTRGEELDDEILRAVIKLCVKEEAYEIASVVQDILSGHRREKIERILNESSE